VTTQPRKIILHIGGPKCGSSALQAALSETPRLRSTLGPDLSYIAARPSGTKWRVLQGRALRIATKRSVHSYVSWPNLGPQNNVAPVFVALDSVWRASWRSTIPVLSNESWVGQANTFENRLPHWFIPADGAPIIDVQAYARPPLDWLNSAYWQWGVWTGRSFDSWLQNIKMSYQLGAQFSMWRALKNVRLRVHLAGNVLDHFNADHGVTLTSQGARNTSQSPAMVGFMLRNRRFRKTPHDSATEFVVQRWCHLADAPRLWAVMPRHIQVVRQSLRSDVARLFDLLPEDEQRNVRQTDRRWTSDEPYHDIIRAGRSKIDDPEQLAQLYGALCDGVRRATISARTPQLDSPPALSAGIAVWDGLVAIALDHLIEIDTNLRLNRLRALLD